MRVTDEKAEAWVQEDKIVDFTIGNSSLSLRLEVESSAFRDHNLENHRGDPGFKTY